MLSAEREVTPRIIERLQNFAARHPTSLYARAARHTVAKLKANPNQSPAAIRQAFFKKLMAQ